MANDDTLHLQVSVVLGVVLRFCSVIKFKNAHRSHRVNFFLGVSSAAYPISFGRGKFERLLHTLLFLHAVDAQADDYNDEGDDGDDEEDFCRVTHILAFLLFNDRCDDLLLLEDLSAWRVSWLFLRINLFGRRFLVGDLCRVPKIDLCSSLGSLFCLELRNQILELFIVFKSGQVFVTLHRNDGALARHDLHDRCTKLIRGQSRNDCHKRLLNGGQSFRRIWVIVVSHDLELNDD